MISDPDDRTLLDVYNFLKSLEKTLGDWRVDLYAGELGLNFNFYHRVAPIKLKHAVDARDAQTVPSEVIYHRIIMYVKEKEAEWFNDIHEPLQP